jgi:hypothetical protein
MRVTIIDMLTGEGHSGSIKKIAQITGRSIPFISKLQHEQITHFNGKISHFAISFNTKIHKQECGFKINPDNNWTRLKKKQLNGAPLYNSLVNIAV